jgi:TonB family protein
MNEGSNHRQVLQEATGRPMLPTHNSPKNSFHMNIRLMSACSLAAALSVSALTPLSAAVLENAKPVSQEAPAYSPSLRASCVEGNVVISFTITSKGDVINPVVVSSTDEHLNNAALDAVRKWKFAPATKDGVAVTVKALQPVAFVIPELHSSQAAKLMAANSKPASAGTESTSVN